MSANIYTAFYSLVRRFCQMKIYFLQTASQRVSRKSKILNNNSVPHDIFMRGHIRFTRRFFYTYFISSEVDSSTNFLVKTYLDRKNYAKVATFAKFNAFGIFNRLSSLLE